MAKSSKHTQIKRSKPPVPVFVAATVALFFLSLSAADSVGFVPYYIDGTSPSSPTSNADEVALSSLPQLGITSDTGTSTVATSGIEPVKIEIPSVGIDLPVQNPTTTDVDTLDTLLDNGPAHYIDSADLGDSGNVIIFAHSSHLPIVHNKMFQAFNQIPNVKAGDSITLIGSDGKEYLYSVVSVVKATTDDGTEISTSPSVGKELTLVTCDTLTGVSARFILTANYVGSYDPSSAE